MFRDFAFRTLIQDFFFTGVELSEIGAEIIGESSKSGVASCTDWARLIETLCSGILLSEPFFRIFFLLVQDYLKTLQ